jgi:iron complex transport system substrate-binding protein
MTALRALSISLSLVAGSVCAQQTPPQRVVSMNLCTDQFALMLAAPGQLVSVSHLSADPVTSPMAAEAAGHRLNHGSAEQIYLMAPDLVLAHTWTDPTAIAMLRRLGIPVIQIAGVQSLSDIPERLAEVGALLGRSETAQTLSRQFETDLAALPTLFEGPIAALYGANGYTTGQGTLSHEMLTRAGFRNITAEIVPSATGRIALELLVMAAPDLILRAQRYPGTSQAEAILNHPALQALIAASAGHEISPDWACGTPRVVSALQSLVEARQSMVTTP